MKIKAYQDQNIFVAGHRGMVGSAIVSCLKSKGYRNIITASREDLDLRDGHAVRAFFKLHEIDLVYLAAARVGGVYANSKYPADFIYDNIMIAANTIEAAHQADIQKIIFLGSSCIYPRITKQPIKEEALLGGKLEPTNEPYAIAKIAGIKLCESYNRQHGRDYRSIMPTNLYGPNDNFHSTNSHVIPALLKRFHQAKESKENEVFIWGSGTPRREFLHVNDMASACVHIMETSCSKYQDHTLPMMSHINVGTGVDCSIRELAESIAKICGFSGRISFDTSKPDGTPVKLLDTARIKALGWKPSITLKDGLQTTYSWYLENIEKLRAS